MEIELIEQIEKFLNKELSREELENYSRTNDVIDLDEKINWVRNTSIAIEQEGLRNQMSQLFEAKSSNKKGRVIRLSQMKWAIGLAASFLILITGFWLNRGFDDDSFSGYNYIDPGLPVVMSQSDNYEMYDALSYYSEENYTITIEKLENIVAAGNANDTIYYYLGASQLYTDKYETSISSLDRVRNNTASVFKEKAEWLIVVNQLRQEKFNEVKRLIETILEDEDHEFHKQAKALKTDLQEKNPE